MEQNEDDAEDLFNAAIDRRHPDDLAQGKRLSEAC